MSNEDFKILFGRRLAFLREEQKLSYRVMATRCDIDSSNISKIEKGQKDIQLSTVAELAKGLNRHPKELFDFGFDLEKE